MYKRSTNFITVRSFSVNKQVLFDSNFLGILIQRILGQTNKLISNLLLVVLNHFKLIFCSVPFFCFGVKLPGLDFIKSYAPNRLSVLKSI